KRRNSKRRSEYSSPRRYSKKMEPQFFMRVKLSESQFFSLLRLLLGAWLVIHFLRLLPYMEEVYSLSGVRVAGGELYLKDMLHPLRTSQGIYLIGVFATFCSLGFMLKIYRRVMSGILFIIWIFLYHQNILTYTPILPYIGWLLLALSFIKDNEVRFPWQESSSQFEFSTILFHGFWIITALTYTSSGLQKFLYSPLWKEGKAFDFILSYPASRSENIFILYSQLPLLLKILVNYSAICAESFYALSFFNSKLRKFFWMGILIMHLVILITLRFEELSIGMIIIHSFLIEKDWFKFGGLSKITWRNNWN
ncbi:MAG: hypothetical protein K2Q18_11925, partial [Bdellovibrionales bacterium]|nr:hypothetical protein [Bdellovibrionales bacterium]